MFVAFLMIGLTSGFLAGITALTLGYGFAAALAIYALSGIAGTLLGALLSLLPQGPAPSRFGKPHLANEA